ncbi:Hypothetical protein CAP_3792 [Chondromyces apiculatus DSM 436]|uniref:Uncharacterized protein n=1 Tax=Chondromyces apiculatus DSM 436 TaxID=1192034 RepID=A0A017T8Q2_9BACT|nr:Hypothetical protein CAP_3792 [Chondromyces apiculatus DSM 436]
MTAAITLRPVRNAAEASPSTAFARLRCADCASLARWLLHTSRVMLLPAPRP